MKKFLFIRIAVIVVFAVGISGCAILQLPGEIIGGVFGLLGKLINLAGKLPHPPPWVWGN